jgi:hypothetical protein
MRVLLGLGHNRDLVNRRTIHINLTRCPDFQNERRSGKVLDAGVIDRVPCNIFHQRTPFHHASNRQPEAPALRRAHGYAYQHLRTRVKS